MKSLLIIPLIVSTSIFGQSELNQFDSIGKKTGLWIDSVSDNIYKRESYYKSGIKNGVEKVYSKKGKTLSFFGEYKNGHLVGTGYYFDDNGFLSFTILYEGFVAYRGKRYQKGKKYQKGFFTLYNKEGKIIESGTAFFVEGEEEFGEEIRLKDWKHY